jgi:hypothetical protein
MFAKKSTTPTIAHVGEHPEYRAAADRLQVIKAKRAELENRLAAVLANAAEPPDPLRAAERVVGGEHPQQARADEVRQLRADLATLKGGESAAADAVRTAAQQAIGIVAQSRFEEHKALVQRLADALAEVRAAVRAEAAFVESLAVITQDETAWSGIEPPLAIVNWNDSPNMLHMLKWFPLEAWQARLPANYKIRVTKE